MIDKTTAIETVLQKVKKLESGHCLDLRTYKRNRSVVIKKISADDFLLVENGFEQAHYQTSFSKMGKILKLLLKKEFPRSTKIRLYDLGPCDPSKLREMKTL